MKKEVTLLPPMMPNFISYSIGEVFKRQDGFKPSDRKIAVSSLTEEEAIEYGELMKQAFIEHWRNKKQYPTP